jgi:hypothetical protein
MKKMNMKMQTIDNETAANLVWNAVCGQKSPFAHGKGSSHKALIFQNHQHIISGR